MGCGAHMLHARSTHLCKIVWGMHTPLQDSMGHAHASVQVSNELMDAFGSHKLLVGYDPEEPEGVGEDGARTTESTASPAAASHRIRVQRARVLPLIRLGALSKLVRKLVAASSRSSPRSNRVTLQFE